MNEPVPRWFSVYPEVGLPAVTTLPAGSRAEGGGWSAVATNRVLWVSDGDRVGRLALLGPWTLVGLEDGVLAWSGGGVDVRLGSRGVEVEPDPRIRWGRDTVVRRAPGGPWTVDGGPELPEGARFAKTCRPLPIGRGVIWCDQGYVYRWTLTGAPRVLGCGSAFHVDAGRVRPGPGPLPPVPEPPEIPGDADRTRARVADLRVVAVRVEGGRVRGWLRDGTVVVDVAQP